MADGGDEMLKQLSDITECCICLKTFSDPRILPCVHTFCLKCLQKTSMNTEKTSEEEMSCPVCRTVFTIPKNGLSGLQKNFFMAKLIGMTNASRRAGNGSHGSHCRESGLSVVSMRDGCLECKDGSFEDCVKHKRSSVQGLTAGEEKVRDEDEEDEDGDEIDVTRRMTEVEMRCDQHTTMPFEVYCHDCQRIICFKCLVDEQHKGHKGSTVDSVANEFRQEIHSNLEKVSNYKILSHGLMKEAEKQRESVAAEFDEKERAVLERSRHLKKLVDRHTKDLLDELSSARKERLKDMETKKEESERFHTILESSEVYFSEVKTKGSPAEICRVKDEMSRRTNELGEILSRIKLTSVEVSFHETNLEESLTAGENLVGKIKIDSMKIDAFQKCVLVVGLSQDETEPNKPDAIKMNLRNPIEISFFDSASTVVNRELATAVSNNMLFVAGLGDKSDEVWKYHLVSGWIKCGYLILGRVRHCVAFLGDVLYVFGGYADPDGILDSVEAYNTLSNKCVNVGKLIRGVRNATCVPYKNSIYVFYGLCDENITMDDIQVYDTVKNTCTRLKGPSPRPFSPMNTWRAVLWEDSVILVGRWTCFIFDLEEETWQERKNLKVNVDYFGLVLDGGNVYVIGGGVDAVDDDDNWFWKRVDDVRCLSVDQIIRGSVGSSPWKNVAKLPIPALVYACDVITFPTEQ